MNCTERTTKADAGGDREMSSRRGSSSHAGDGDTVMATTTTTATATATMDVLVQIDG